MITALWLALVLLPWTAAMATEEPGYTVLATRDGIEYRRYAPYLVAETLIAGEADRDAAANEGFRRLFKYISGDNATKTSIAMTAPVQQIPEPSATALAVEQSFQANGWKVGFPVPATFNAANVPAPASADVSIREVPARMMAVIRYSGRWTDKNVQQHVTELLQKVKAAGLAMKGQPESAFYNAPVSPPFMRRNEAMIEVDRAPAG